MRFMHTKGRLPAGVVMVLGLLGHALCASAQDDQDLAKASQNPVGDLVSLPFQNNMNFDVGPDDRVQNIMNIQPVYPIALNEDWNLITRTILPVISQPAPGDDRTDGIGDLNFTGFISPRAPGEFIWGLGPVLAFPTASDDVLGTEKYSAGISAVVLTMPGRWVVGALANNVWSYAGDDDRDDVNSFLFQYFINYNFPSGWYFTSAPIMTANWEADSNDRWTVPVGGRFWQDCPDGQAACEHQQPGFLQRGKAAGRRRLELAPAVSVHVSKIAFAKGARDSDCALAAASPHDC